MMDCDKIREQIDALSAKCEAVPAGDRAFHDHIAGCEPCRRLYEERRAQIRLLDGWAVPEARGNIQARVMAGIAQLERERGKASAWPAIAAAFTRRFQIPAAIAVGMAAVLVASIGLNVLLLSSRHAPDRYARRAAPAPAVSVAQTAEETQRIITDAVGQNAPVLLGAGFSEGKMVPLGILILGAPPITENGTQTRKTGI